MLEKLEQHPKFASARTVLLYYSLDDEVQTHDFVEKWHRQKTVLLPVVKGDELELRIYTGRQNLKTGEAYHIEEPTGEAFTAYEKIDFAIIPGVSLMPEATGWEEEKDIMTNYCLFFIPII